jgi:uncharacterized circularly permuted ATP-grasp superfamily protein
MTTSAAPNPPALNDPLLAGYRGLEQTWDELFDDAGRIREPLRRVVGELGGLSRADFARRQSRAEKSLFAQGVTFSVNKDARGTEKIFPFCLIPRVVAAAEWEQVERGLKQRVMALQLFLHDVYGPQRIFAQGVIPRDLVLGSRQYLEAARHWRPPRDVRVHISGIDLVRDGQGRYLVLEDNLRTPSGVSYVVENRIVGKQALPALLDRARVRRVDTYPARLAETLRASAPAGIDDPTIVVLTPGAFNSAYFEHSFLARTMGVELVQNTDLLVEDDRVWMRTTRGPAPVHVIYRRTDETFLDPLCEGFRSDSLLGVPGLMRAYAAGNVTLANAPGNGVADDKAAYAFVPDMIRYYLGEEPLLAQVPTFVCARDDDRRHVLDHLDTLVVKTVDEAGGYGMLMGPQASRSERAEFAEKVAADPRRFIAQPLVELSTCPTWIPETGRVEPRRIDWRPYVLTGPDGPWVLPGGLTRVALVEGSYVVNSSQGGGSKDTWVLRADP